MNTIAQSEDNFGLPFVSRDKEAHSNWLVRETGDYLKDYSKGKAFARRAITAVREEVITPIFVTDIIKAMPAVKGVIECAFINEIARSAAQGAT